ncbi:hypothetical protein CAPTEDRAFT_155420 [Capitella teleta]|uniref:RING-type domain-containing protein n=1 Tax=Capitella teleta TaxID=283909 RepID=R7V245_CAPTE|nr:hypothetical protein CAPTEDRAFT_155420 [Capitella teleta]|eukprot:ELU12923.1 hypothetical protein CAPTEDRAFT_155420 [Capitella teleta]
MLSCPEGHLFCSECIRRSSEEILGLAKLDFPCLQAGCGSPFTLSTLQKALKPKTFDLLLRKIQETEIEQAGLDDLVKCPFCTFATIMPNPEDKVLYCKNPDCLRESCRLCQEPNHIPLRCEEVEKQGETDMRTFIEMRVSEAMLRTCWSCKKRFYKTEGCNKMTCSCGASMCYVCRKPVNDYEHFGGRKGQCPQSSNEAQLHQQEMEKALIEAKAKYQMEHPETAGLKLKHDPELIIAKSDSQPKDFLFNPHHYENSDSSTDSDEDGYY